MTALLIDIGPLSQAGSDAVLEDMHKALSEDADIWRPHDSVFIRQLIEDITGKGQAALESLGTDLRGWIELRALGVDIPVPTPPEFLLWSAEKSAKVFAYLSGKPQAVWSASDYSLLVDYLVHKHFPDEFPTMVADLAVKQGAIMGKVQAAAPLLTPEEAAALVTHFAAVGVGQAIDAADIHYLAIDYGMQHCSEHVVAFSDGVRSKLKATILDYEKSSRMFGGDGPRGALQTKLFDSFAEFNRDWRRIAVTETGEMANQGFISSIPVGQKVKRLEQYAGACPFCKKIDGVVATVVDPKAPDKDWDTQIWLGKNNVGRSASPYKRVGGTLVKRTDAELWKLPAGLAHPHCRGVWIPVSTPAVPDDFTLWLDGVINPQN